MNKDDDQLTLYDFIEEDMIQEDFDMINDDIKEELDEDLKKIDDEIKDDEKLTKETEDIFSKDDPVERYNTFLKYHPDMREIH